MDNFKELEEERVDTPPKVVKDILKTKNTITGQLKALRSNRNIKGVQEFIDSITNDERASKYLLYLIDKYYYNKKGLVRPEKNGLEKEFKMLWEFDD